MIYDCHLSLFYRFHLIFINADLYLLCSPALRPARPLTMKASSECGASQLHSAIHAAAGPAPPLPLARAELNQFKVCSVIAEEMGRWRRSRNAATMVFLLSTILREEVSVYKKRQLVDKHFEMIWKSLVPQIQACPGLQQLQGVFSCHYTYQPTELYKKAGCRLQGRQQLFKTLLVIASF